MKPNKIEEMAEVLAVLFFGQEEGLALAAENMKIFLNFEVGEVEQIVVQVHLIWNRTLK